MMIYYIILYYIILYYIIEKFNTTGMFILKIVNYRNPYVVTLNISTLSFRRDKKKYDITNTWET